MNKKLLLLFYFLLSTIYLTNAQSSWQWGSRGGSADVGGGAGVDETVVDMATDPHGNVYVLSKVLQTGLNVDGHAITGWGGDDILITSYKCDGTYRWSKDIGSSTEDLPVALKTDTLGGVYVAANCEMFLATHIDVDTTLPGSLSVYKELLLVKFDTGGAYKWLRTPQPDTTSISSAPTRPLDMDVDGAGNIYWMCALPPGAYAGGSFIVTTTGVYILKYDNSGSFISGTQMQIGYTGVAVAGLSIKKDFQNGRYYITGNAGLGGGVAGLSFGGIPVTHPLFIGCFDNSGTLLWYKQNTSTYDDGGFGRADIDMQHNIYMTGISAYFVANDTFNGYVVVNTEATYAGVPLIVKLDTNGNNIWATNGSSPGVALGNVLTLNGLEVDIAGSYGGVFKWPGYSDSLNLASGAGYDVFITRFNTTTGAVIGLDSLASDFGYDEHATRMASDKFGNFYVGGDFASTLTVASTTLNSAGGGSDFFVAKYGTSNCDTVHIPALEAPPGLPRGEELSVYPNPATDELNISGVVQNTSYSVFNITGIVIEKGVLHEGVNTVSMHGFASGVYILEMTDTDGERKVVRVVKE